MFRKLKNNTVLWTVELGKKAVKINWIIVRLLHDNKNKPQEHMNSVLDWLLISSAVRRLGSDRYPDNYKNLVYQNNVFYKA